MAASIHRGKQRRAPRDGVSQQNMAAAYVRNAKQQYGGIAAHQINDSGAVAAT